MFQTSESCIKLHAVVVLELLLSEQCPLLQVCVCVCVCPLLQVCVCVCVHCSRCVCVCSLLQVCLCVCVSTAPGVCVCVHCSRCVCVCVSTAPGVCVCVCPLLQVCVCVHCSRCVCVFCVRLDGLNTENKFHCWLYSVLYSVLHTSNAAVPAAFIR